METNHLKNKTYWIRPATISTYNSFEAYLNLEEIDWPQHDNKYSIGDIVYIYACSPYMYISHECEVIDININKEDTIDDSIYFNNDYKSTYTGKYIRLKLLRTFESKITLKDLNIKLLKGTIRLNIDQVNIINKLLTSEVDSELVDNNIYEGSVKRVYVDKYERSLYARSKCIEQYGCTCLICGFNFEKKYGPIGKDYIEVHHLVPLSKIKKEYKVDYIKDLIPVCPNCHAMIHRLDNLDKLSIIDIKNKLNIDK